MSRLLVLLFVCDRPQKKVLSWLILSIIKNCVSKSRSAKWCWDDDDHCVNRSIYLSYIYYSQKLLIVDTVGKTFWKTAVLWVPYLWVVVVVECRIISFHFLQAQVLNLVSPLVAHREILWCFVVVCCCCWAWWAPQKHTPTHPPTQPPTPEPDPFLKRQKLSFRFWHSLRITGAVRKLFATWKMQISPSTMVIDRLQFLAGFFSPLFHHHHP